MNLTISSIVKIAQIMPTCYVERYSPKTIIMFSWWNVIDELLNGAVKEKMNNSSKLFEHS